MAITISGENNNDRILAADGVIDQISGINIVGLITASHINVGSNIQLGNAGIITATTFVGNLTGNVNSTSPLLLQTGGSERFRITGDNALGIAGANYGSSGQVLTSGGSGSAVTWSAIPAQITFSNPSNNRILTSEGGIGVNAEANLTWDGNKIHATATGEIARFQSTNSVSTIRLYSTASGFTEIGHTEDTYIAVGGGERFRITQDGNVIIAETMAVNRPRIVLSAPDQGSSAYSHLFGANLQVNGSGTFTTPTANISGGGWEYLSANSLNAHGHLRYLSAPDTNATSSTPLERLRIDATGRVLIGVNATTNSDSYVQAFKDTGNDATITVGNVATSASGLCRYDFAPSNKVVGSRIECHATEDFSTSANRTADLVFITRLNGTLSEKLRITSAGHIQLQGGTIYGDDSAAPTFKLQSTSANNNHSRIEIGAIQSSDNGGIHFYTAGSSVATRNMTLKGTGGYLGIGVDNPSYKTQIQVTDTTAYSASTISANQFQLAITNTGAAGVAGILFVTEPSSGNGGHCGIRALSTGNGSSALTFSTRGSNTSAERLRIDSSGRVMIGSSTYIGGAALAVLGTSTTPNTYACFAMGRVGANVTNDTAIANIRLNGGTLGTGRGAEINAYADANWSDGSSHPTRLTFHTVASGSTSATERLRISANGSIKFATSNSSTDYLQYGNNPRLWLRCPSNMNGLRIDASTTPLEVRSSDANQRSISIGGSPNFDMSLSGDYSLSSSSQRDNSPTIFLNTTRWNGSSTVTSFQTSIQAVTTSNSNNIGYLGFGASASPQNITIHTDNHICLAENVTSDLTDTCLVRIASTFKNTVRNGSGRCVERGFYSMNTGSGSVDYFHMKTDMATNSGCMFLFTLRGYAYGSGKVMFAQTCGYCYSATNTIINDQDKSWDGDTILSTYKSSDGYVVVRAQMSSWSSYYSGFHIDVSYQNPATGTMKYKVTASAINNASDHYA